MNRKTKAVIFVIILAICLTLDILFQIYNSSEHYFNYFASIICSFALGLWAGELSNETRY